MAKRRPRVEIQPTPWAKDPGKWPFGKVILPPELKWPKRLMVPLETLASLLRCPRDLISAFLRQGQLHEASSGEIAASLGLCAEDFAALALGGVLCLKYNLRLEKLVLRIIGELRSELLEAPHPMRVILGVFRANQRTEARVGTCCGELAIWDVPKEQAAATDFYDASLLRDEIDSRLSRQPLKFPSAESCLVKRPQNL